MFYPLLSLLFYILHIYKWVLIKLSYFVDLGVPYQLTIPILISITSQPPAHSSQIEAGVWHTAMEWTSESRSVF